TLAARCSAPIIFLNYSYLFPRFASVQDGSKCLKKETIYDPTAFLSALPQSIGYRRSRRSVPELPVPVGARTLDRGSRRPGRLRPDLSGLRSSRGRGTRRQDNPRRIGIAA